MEVIISQPRGFCAGVNRAIQIVELAIKKFGTPIYVKHEIVHNKFVIEGLKSRGVVFTDDLTQIPNGAVVIYSAHGVSTAIEEQAKNLKLIPIDATCPLVKKVHREVAFYDENGFEIILIGHKNHPEIEGTAGRIKNSKFILVEDAESAKTVQVQNPQKLALATQTTLSVDDTKDIIEILTERFPSLKENIKNDICYATQNRQDAVKQLIANGIDALIVIGSINSSNSNRLKQLGSSSGILSFLVDEPDLFNFNALKGVTKIGITAGASAPEELVNKMLNAMTLHYSNVNINYMEGIKEDTVFFLPKELR